MNISGLLNKFNKSSDYVVGAYISQSSILEVILYENKSGMIIKSARAEVNYDLASRQIDRLDIFNATLIELLEKMEISFKIPIIISLPTVIISKQLLPLNLEEEEIKTVLTSDAERNYIFKKQEPYVSWQKIKILEKEDVQDILFSAVQALQVDLIKESLKSYKISAIDSAFTSLIRGVASSGLVNEQIENNSRWDLAMITPLSFVSFEFKGNKILEIHENPIAIRSINSNEIYPTIASFCNENIKYNEIEHLIIVSELSEISSEILVERLDVKCKISPINQNKVGKKLLLGGEKTISEYPEEAFLQSIGAASWNKSPIKLGFNFLSEKGFNDLGPNVKFVVYGKTIVLTSILLEKILLVLIATSFLVISGLFLILSTLIGAMNQELQTISTQKASYQSLIEKIKNRQIRKENVSVKDVTPTVYNQNTKFIQSFLSIGQNIPEKLWLKTFELRNDMTAKITGQAYSVSNIMDYYQSLTLTGSFSNLKISSIKIIGGNESFNKNNEVTIVTPNNSQSPSRYKTSHNLPSLPSVPIIQSTGASGFTKEKYYEFTFSTAVSN